MNRLLRIVILMSCSLFTGLSLGLETGTHWSLKLLRLVMLVVTTVALYFEIQNIRSGRG